MLPLLLTIAFCYCYSSNNEAEFNRSLTFISSLKATLCEDGFSFGVTQGGGRWGWISNCFACVPPRYQTTPAWPERAWRVRASNIPAAVTTLQEAKKKQQWVECKAGESTCIVPGGSTCGPTHLVAETISSLLLPMMKKGRLTFLDIGSGVPSLDMALSLATGGRIESLGLVPVPSETLALMERGGEPYSFFSQSFIAAESNRNCMFSSLSEANRVPMVSSSVDFVYCCFCTVGCGPFVPHFPVNSPHKHFYRVPNQGNATMKAGPGTPSPGVWGNGHGLVLEAARLLAPGGIFIFDWYHLYGTSNQLLNGLCMTNVSTAGKIQYSVKMSEQECRRQRQQSSLVPLCSRIQLADGEQSNIVPCRHPYVEPVTVKNMVERRPREPPNDVKADNELMELVRSLANYDASYFTRFVDFLALDRRRLPEAVLRGAEANTSAVRFYSLSASTVTLRDLAHRGQLGVHHDWCKPNLQRTFLVPRSVDVAFALQLDRLPLHCFPKLAYELDIAVRPGGLIVTTLISNSSILRRQEKKWRLLAQLMDWSPVCDSALLKSNKELVTIYASGSFPTCNRK